MIKENRIIFGYGTVMIGSNHGILSFTWIKPPKEIGDPVNVDEVECIAELTFDFKEDFLKLKTDISKINSENSIINFRGCVLDFSNYNEKSVEALKIHLSVVINNMIICLAC